MSATSSSSTCRLIIAGSNFGVSPISFDFSVILSRTVLSDTGFSLLKAKQVSPFTWVPTVLVNMYDTNRYLYLDFPMVLVFEHYAVIQQKEIVLP